MGAFPGTPVIAADGTLYGWGGPTHHRTLEALSADGSLKWSTSLGSTSYGGGKLAIRSDGNLYAFDGQQLASVTPSGAIDWAMPEGGCISPPTLVIGPDESAFLFAATSCGTALPLDLLRVARDGTASPVGPLPIIATSEAAVEPDGTLAYAGLTPPPGAAGLFATAPSGSLSWTASYPGIAYDAFANAPSVPMTGSDGSVVVPSTDGLHAYDAKGTPLWFVSPTTSLAARASDGTAYASTGTALTAFDPYGHPAWTWAPGSGHTLSGVVIVDGSGTAFVSLDAGVAAVAPGGTLLWQIDGVGVPVALDARGVLYAQNGPTLTALR